MAGICGIALDRLFNILPSPYNLIMAYTGWLLYEWGPECRHHCRLRQADGEGSCVNCPSRYTTQPVMVGPRPAYCVTYWRLLQGRPADTYISPPETAAPAPAWQTLPPPSQGHCSFVLLFSVLFLALCLFSSASCIIFCQNKLSLVVDTAINNSRYYDN